MHVSVIVATYGDRAWADLADRAATSADGQGAHEIIVLHRDDATLAEVRNEAAAAATGDWLCHLDADDRLGTGYLDAMRMAGARDAAERQSLLVPAVQYVDRAGRCQGDPAIPAWARSLADLNCAVIGTLIPRDLFHTIGGFQGWPIYEDYDLWLRSVIAGARMVPVSDAVYCAHVRTGGRNQADRETQVRVYNEIRAAYSHVPAEVWEQAKV